MTGKLYSYHVVFDRREMVSMPPDKIPTEKEALEQLHKALTGQVSSMKLRWYITAVIAMDEDGDQEYLINDSGRWRRREDVECNG